MPNKESPMSVEFGPFEVLKTKSTATRIQRYLLPWMISLHGIAYKTMKLEEVKEMLSLVIDAEDLLGVGRPCSELVRTYSVGFNTVAKMAKSAAGLYIFIN